MSEQDTNLELTRQWEKLYNEDADRMVLDCYAPDCTVTAMGSGEPLHGHAILRKVEEVVLEAAPRRRLRVDQRHAAGGVVVVEAVLLDPDQGEDWQLPMVAVLTCKDGKIINDRSYADWSRWPGI